MHDCSDVTSFEAVLRNRTLQNNQVMFLHRLFNVRVQDGVACPAGQAAPKATRSVSAKLYAVAAAGSPAELL